MTINVYTICHNEQFMLPHFLNHYEQFADRIFVIDDHSTDMTAEIAKAHPMVSYHEYPFEGWDEDEVNDTFRSFYNSSSLPIDGSDLWAVTVDCDEFITGLDDLERWTDSGVLQTRGYMMIGRTGKLEDCKKVRMSTFDKPVVFQPPMPDNCKFSDGRHTIDCQSWPSDLELLHYKYPSREYYLQRSLDTYPRIMDAKQMSYRIKRGLRYYDQHVK